MWWYMYNIRIIWLLSAAEISARITFQAHIYFTIFIHMLSVSSYMYVTINKSAHFFSARCL